MSEVSTPLTEALNRCKLSQREAAVLLRTTVLTAHRYVNGAMPQTRLSARYNTVVNVLNALANAQKLPLKFSKFGEERERRAKAIDKIRAHVDALMRG